MPYTDETIMTKGKYKFRRLKEIPAEYFLNIHKNGCDDKELKLYVQTNIESISARVGLPIPPPNLVTFICDKKTFPTKEAARKSLQKIRSVNSDDDKPIRVYECPYCSGWHLTAMPIDVFKMLNKEQGVQESDTTEAK